MDFQFLINKAQELKQESDIFYNEKIAQLEKLGDDWEIIEYTSTLIRLKDVSGENGEVDYLTFVRN